MLIPHFLPSLAKDPPYAGCLVLPPLAHSEMVTLSPSRKIITAYTFADLKIGDPPRLQLNKTGAYEAPTYEAFRQYHCQSCEYYFDEKIEEDDEDEYGNSVKKTITSCCDAFREGVSAVFNDHVNRCAANESYDEFRDEREGDFEMIDITLPPLAFSYNYDTDKISVGTVSWDWDSRHQLLSTTRHYGMLNVGDTEGEPCWGDNDCEFCITLHNCIQIFISSPFNEDLMIQSNFDRLKRDVPDRQFNRINDVIILRSPDRQFQCDALLDAKDADLFALKAIGLEPEKWEADYLPLLRHRERGIDGFITPRIPGTGHCAFIARDRLIATIPVPSSQSPCQTTS